MDTHTYQELQAAESDMPWIQAFSDEVVHGKEINESGVFLYIAFPKRHPYVDVHMMVEPHPQVTNKRRRPLVDVELYTAPGQLKLVLQLSLDQIVARRLSCIRILFTISEADYHRTS